MLKFLLLECLLLLFGQLTPENKKVKIFLAGDSTMSIKKTAKYPETGWGMPFTYFWDSSVTVINKAQNGRSTRTFREVGIWPSIISELEKGDYIFIQFGHNDASKDRPKEYVAPDQYKINLIQYVADVRAKGGIPILITPPGRRRFDPTGKLRESHELYSPKVLEVAKEQKTLFIDLDKKSMELYRKFGEEKSRLLFLHLKKGEHPNYPNGLEDDTHFNELGARYIAQIVLAELRKMNLDLKSRIIVPAK